MRRKDRERDRSFAWEVLKNSIYSTVSMVCPDGTPYATPVNIIGDEVYNALYFHCAGAGEDSGRLELTVDWSEAADKAVELQKVEE